MSEASNKFLEDMADDFFSECDELLAIIRRSLFRIDNLKGTGKPPKSLLEDLLRSAHTLKGLTGMIGAEEIMTLTHTIENYLKAAYEEEIVIPTNELDVLFKSFHVVEKQLESLRNKMPLPESASVIHEVNSIIPVSYQNRIRKKGTAQLISDSAERETSGKIAGMKWKFTFIPSKELFERGINVDEVRSRLSKIGEVISSTPRTGTDGNITFEFVVSATADEADFREWIDDGIRHELFEDPENTVNLMEEDRKQDQVNIISGHLQKNVVRVDLNRLDDLMRCVGDLVVTRSRLDENIAKSSMGQKDELSRLNEINVQMERQLRELREGIIKLRLVSTGEAFERMRFVVRDLVSESNKSIELRLEGEDTQIDKFVMEKMFDPLLHLVRNAVSHGIEPAEERKLAGKHSSGTLQLKASASGSNVIFEVSDDGYGIDREKVAEKARSMGIIGKDEVVDDTALLNIICIPGFSVREETDRVSGRGVGMDVVLKTVSDLGGSLSMDTVKGRGTSFIITLPITLSIVDALIIRSAGNTFAIPMPSVSEVISISGGDLSQFHGYEMMRLRNKVLPVIRLDRFFRQSTGKSASHAVIIGNGSSRAGILVERVLGKKEIVVRALSDPMVKVAGISGATELGEGKIVLILDTAALLRSVAREKGFSKVNTISENGNRR